MITIEHITGRTYDGPQVLRITVESEKTDEFGIREVVAVFQDESRHISGRVQTLMFHTRWSHQAIGAEVLAEYDAGRYQAI